MISRYLPRTRRARFGAVLFVVMITGTSVGLIAGMTGIAQAAATAVPLGTASSFGVLAGAGISNTGPTTINGDIGTFPTTSETGTGSLTISGTNHGGDAVTQGAKGQLVTAYNVAAAEGPTSPITADLGGLTLTPGVYNSASSVGLTGTLTLNAGGDPNAVFIFQAGSSLTTASASQVSLINGAQSCNVFWQVGSSATLGTGSGFDGTIIAFTSITVTTDVSVSGRVLAQNGAVTLDTDTISVPACTTTATTTVGATTTTAGGTATGSVTTTPKVEKSTTTTKPTTAKKTTATTSVPAGPGAKSPSTTVPSTAPPSTPPTTTPPGLASPPLSTPPGFTG